MMSLMNFYNDSSLSNVNNENRCVTHPCPAGADFKILEVGKEQIEAIQNPSAVNTHSERYVGEDPFVKISVVVAHLRRIYNVKQQVIPTEPTTYTRHEPCRSTTEVDDMAGLLLHQVRDELRSRRSVTNDTNALVLEVDGMIPPGGVEHVALEGTDTLHVGREGGGEEHTNSGDDNLRCSERFRAGASISVLKLVDRASSIPVNAGDFGEGDELLVQVPLARESLPVRLDLGLLDVGLRPVGIQLR